jgi:hypothetical protein
LFSFYGIDTTVRTSNKGYIDQALTQLYIEGYPTADSDIARLSPLGHEHINFLGRYHFVLPEAIQRGEYRPLRVPDSTEQSDRE